MSYAAVFLVAIVMMAVCYVHIVIIVRRQQNKWNNLSRVGSTRWSGGRTVCHSNKTHREQKQLEGNIRAICTTLLILGSCVIGWMPALLMFTLICEVDCLVHGRELEYLNKTYLIQVMCFRLVENMLVVGKMVANPIIYSIRMKEIQEGTKHMRMALMRIFCPFRPDNRNYTLASGRSPRSNNSSIRTRLTASINNSGHMSHVSIKSEQVNTLL